MRIKWSRVARANVKSIFDYYKAKTSSQIAHSIRRKILQVVQPLNDFPLMGQIEPLLQHKKGNYRYLVEGNYKIIYRVIRMTVVIVTVFDTRRNPQKPASTIKV